MEVDETTRIRESTLVGLQDHFPALRMRVGWADADPLAGLVPLPHVFGYILATAQAHVNGTTLLVVDRGQWLAPLAAMLVSIHRFGREADRLVKEFGVTRLQKGQRVRVYPTDYVYEFDGLFRGYQEFVRLRVVGTGERNETRSFPASQILRLHPTEHLRPKGTQATRFPDADTPLEALVGVRTYANPAVFQTFVVYCGSHGEAKAFCESLRWSSGPDAVKSQPGAVIPWGSVGPDGTVTYDDRYQSVGAPMVLVARTLEDVEIFCQREENQVAVIVDGFQRAVGHRATLGRIAANRHVIILASPSEVTAESEIRNLAEQGARIWYMAPDEVLYGVHEYRPERLPEPIGSVMRACLSRKHVTPWAVPCQDSMISGLHSEFERSHRLLRAHDRDGEDAFSDSFAMLFWISRFLGEVGFLGVESILERMKLAREMLNAETAWMPPPVVELLKAAFQRLDGLVAGNIAGVSGDKKQKLLEILKDAQSQYRERIVVCTRDGSSVELLRRWLGGYELHPDIHTAREAARAPAGSWDLALLLGWHRSELFLTMVSGGVARDVAVLAYPFEQKDFEMACIRQEGLLRQWPALLSDLVEITGLDVHELPGFRPSAQEAVSEPAAGRQPTSGHADVKSVATVEDIEAWLNRPVRYHPIGTDERAGDTDAIALGFESGSHAFIEPFRQIPRVAAYQNGPEQLQVTPIRADSVEVGDILLFREASDKDIIRLLAEDQLGESQYARLRDVAGQWREALETIGDDPVLVRRRLINHGLERELATIRRWQEDSDLIAPQRHEDVLIIIRASGIHALEPEADRILNAITVLRGAHIASGHELSRLVRERAGAGLRLDLYDDQEIDLGLCTAWLVRVRSINNEVRRVPRSLINQIIRRDALA